MGLRFRPRGLRFRPQGLRSSLFVFWVFVFDTSVAMQICSGFSGLKTYKLVKHKAHVTLRRVNFLRTDRCKEGKAPKQKRIKIKHGFVFLFHFNINFPESAFLSKHFVLTDGIHCLHLRLSFNISFFSKLLLLHLAAPFPK